MDYGPTIAAAFASQDVNQVRDLRRCIVEIMRKCPQNVNPMQGGGGQQAHPMRRAGEGPSATGQAQQWNYGGDERRQPEASNEAPATADLLGWEEPTAGYQHPPGTGSASVGGNRDDVSILTGVISEGFGHTSASIPSHQYQQPQVANPAIQYQQPQVANPAIQYQQPQVANPAHQYQQPQVANPAHQYQQPSAHQQPPVYEQSPKFTENGGYYGR